MKKLPEIRAPAANQRSVCGGKRSRSGESELSPEGGSEGFAACGDAVPPRAPERQSKDCFFFYRDTNRTVCDIPRPQSPDGGCFGNLGMWRMLSCLLQLLVKAGCAAFGDGINDRPDRQISKNEYNGEDHNGHGTPFQPAVEQVCDQIADI